MALATDGRGAPFVRLAGSTTDIGAFEVQARPSFVVDTLLDEDDGDFSFGDVSLREILGLANASDGFDNISIAPSLTGTISLNPMLGPLVISDTVNIVGPGADQLSITAGAGDQIRLIDITATAGDVSLSGLSLLGGDAGVENGGAIRSASTGTLLLKNVELTDNRAASGGAIFASAGTLQLAATTFANNTASADGGGKASTRTSKRTARSSRSAPAPGSS